MGGTGSIKPVLNNNRNLLRKTNFFNKGKSTSERKKELLKNSDGELHFKKITEEKLNALKRRIREKAKKKALRNNSYLIIAFFVSVSILIIYTHNTLKLEKGLEAKIKTQLFNENQLLNTQKYNMYMEDGANQFNKQHWKNAIFFYKKALTVKPQDSLAKIKLRISKNRFKDLNLQ